MNSQAGIICLWVAIGVLLVAIAAVGGVFLWKAIKSLKSFLISLRNTAKQNQELLNGLQAAGEQIQAQIAANHTALEQIMQAQTALGQIQAQIAANHTALGQIQVQITAAVQQVQAQTTAQQETSLSVLNQIQSQVGTVPAAATQIQAAVDTIRAGMTANQIAVSAAINKSAAMSGKIRTEMAAYHTALMEAVRNTYGCSGKIRTEMTAYHAALMAAAESIKTKLHSLKEGNLPDKILDTVLPLNNNDGSTYGFKIPLTDGGMFVAVVHSSRKDDLLKDPEIAHYHYTLMLYNAKGELLDVRAAPVAEKQEK
ncbi:MAG: hypothetical protein J5806_01580 [Lentisphaeria bacterium]|nr:hypothetical protein [Lentisphaeria bacterium]